MGAVGHGIYAGEVETAAFKWGWDGASGVEQAPQTREEEDGRGIQAACGACGVEELDGREEPIGYFV